MAATIKDYENRWKFSISVSLISNFQGMAGRSYKLLDEKMNSEGKCSVTFIARFMITVSFVNDSVVEYDRKHRIRLVKMR